MSDDFLSRWSRLKRGSTQALPADAKALPAEAPAKKVEPVQPASSQAVAPQQPQPLPPVDTLSFDSDFTAFMKPEVDGLLRRQALKTLFQDPRFNVMDGLDVYIDDYSKPDPLPQGWLEKMTQTARLGEYKAPEEEGPPQVDEKAEIVQPEPAELVQKEPQNEVLATPSGDAPSDTLEAPAVPPQVVQSRSPE